ncbi:hypothetical protein RZS08_27255, partial [Arthrospira platensis SPKY1]|nr:hypothetical protein [Arthrospira platensis SPKY1]
HAQVHRVDAEHAAERGRQHQHARIAPVARTGEVHPLREVLADQVAAVGQPGTAVAVEHQQGADAGQRLRQRLQFAHDGRVAGRESTCVDAPGHGAQRRVGALELACQILVGGTQLRLELRPRRVPVGTARVPAQEDDAG